MSSLQEVPALLPSFVGSKARVSIIKMFVFSLGSVLHQPCFHSFCFLSLKTPKSLYSLCSISLDLVAVNLLLSSHPPLSTHLVQVPSEMCSLVLCKKASPGIYRERVTKKKANCNQKQNVNWTQNKGYLEKTGILDREMKPLNLFTYPFAIILQVLCINILQEKYFSEWLQHYIQLFLLLFIFAHWVLPTELTWLTVLYVFSRSAVFLYSTFV